MTASRTVRIDLFGASTKEEVHHRIAQALGFPDYYGRNWDAFDECIHDLAVPVSHIRIIGVAALEAQLPREARLLRECFEDYQQSDDGSGVTVEIQ
jgi:ribonuclease inhibitor